MRRTLDDAMGGAARGGRRADGDVAGRPEYPLRSQETPHYLRRFKFVHNGVDVYFSEDDVPVADMSGVSPGSVGPTQGGVMAGSVAGGTATAAGGIHTGLAGVGLENGALAAAESPECSDSEMDISGGGGRPTSPLKRASVQLEDAKVPSAKKPHHTFGDSMGGGGAGGGPAGGPGSTPSESDDADMMNTDDAVVLPSPSASPITGSDTPDGDDSAAAVGFQDKVSQHVSASLAEIPGLVGAFDSLPEPMKKYAIYRMLQQCDRSTLSAVAGIVVPALRVDFISLLPVELSYNILSFLDYKTLCMAAQVSRSWRQIVDSSEWVWRHRLLRDEFTLQPGELERALREGWDYTSWGRSVAPVPPASISTPVRSRRATDGDGDAIIPANLDHHRRQHHLLHQHHHHNGAHNGAHDEEAINESIPPSPGTPDDDARINVYKAIYRRKHLISRNWMDPQSKPHHLRIRGHGQDVVTCLQFDDDRIVTGSDDHTISVYDTKTGRLRTRFRGHEGGVWALKYYNKNTLISGSTDKTVRVWDIEKEKCTHIFYGHTSTVRCLDVIEPVKTVDRETGQPIVAPKFPIIVTGSRDATLRMWRLPGPNDPHYLPQTVEEQKNDPFFIRCLHGHTNSVRAISGYGDTVVSGSYDTTVRVWTVSTGECKWQLTGHQQRVYSAVIDHKRDRCVSGSMDWLVKVWCIKTGSLLYTLEGHTSLVGLLDLKQSTLVSAAADSTLRVWDPENGKSMHQLQGHQGAITCFQHDENKVVSGSERTLKLWNIKTGQLIKDLLTDLSGIWQVRFDHQRCVAAVKRKDETYLEVLDFDYDPSTKDEVREIRVVTPEDDAHAS